MIFRYNPVTPSLFLEGLEKEKKRWKKPKVGSQI
jgi:hypothetical protein